MAESGSTGSTPISASGQAFPFSDAPPVRKSQETVLNPEGRPQSATTATTETPQTSTQPEPEIHSLLFPDLSQLSPGEIPDSPHGVKLAHFELVDRIGSGGMGSVFLALDLHLQRYVALKILAPSQAREPSSIQRFLNEARAAARLDYDGIARVHFYGEDCGFHFIAFEYVTGTNARDLISQRGPLNPGDAINFTLQIAHALKHTSAAGVVHRDIKPSNIIVNPAGRAKLVDLGLARKESSESMDDLTVAGTTLGTFDYISPEQAQDPRNVDVRSDIYSLGCTLFHMLTGEPPYPEGTLAQKLLDHQQTFVPNPADVNRRIAPQLAAVTQKMMASDPKKRYQSPESLIRDLLMVASDQGLRGVTPEGLVWSDSLKTNEQPFLAKHAGWIAAVAVLLLIVYSLDRLDKTPPDANQSVANSNINPNDSLENSGVDSNSEEEKTEPSIPADETQDKQPENSLITMQDNLPETIGGSLPQETLPGTGVGNILNLHNPDGIFNQPLVDNSDTPELLIARNSNGNNTPSTTYTDSALSPQIPLAPPEVVSVTPNTPPEKSNTTASPLPDDPETSPLMKSELPESPVVLWAMGASEPQEYNTLEAACANARSGSIIELQYNGFLKDRLEKPITINKNITIRAAKNFRPVVSFTSRLNPDQSDTRMITIREGSLNLVNVDLHLNIQHGVTYPTREHWTLFSVQGSDQLSLKNVTATIQNEAREPAAIIELVRGLGDELEKMKMKTTGSSLNIDPFVLSIQDSVLRGESHGLLVKTARPGRVRVENSMIAVESSLILNEGSTDMPVESSLVELELKHSTVATGSSPFRFASGEAQRFLLPVSVTSENSLYALNPVLVAPFVSMTGATNPADFRSLLSWYGRRNFYHGFELFWTIADDFGSTELTDLNFEDWSNHWSDREGTIEDAAVAGMIQWADSWETGASIFSKVIPQQLQIEQDSENQQDLLASDGSILGASLDRLPTPPKSLTPPRLPLE
jgi:serine/threonine-protein kinase